MSKSRKQRVLEDVERHRRQRNILTLTIAVIIIAIIVLAVVFYPRPSSSVVQLPDYLSHCVFGSLYYHAHPSLTVTISGQNILLPSSSFSASCPQPLHTHDSSGVIHVETDQNRDYTLGDWFLLWGYYANSVQIAQFNNTLIMGNSATPSSGHTLTMTVNGQVYPSTSPYQNLVFPRNAATGQNTCSVGNCAAFSVVLTYT